MIRYFRKVIRYFWVIILTTAIFSTFAAVNSVYLMKDVYEGHLSYYVYQGATGDTYRDLLSGDMLAADISNIIKSDYIIDKTKAGVPAYQEMSNKQITDKIDTVIINNTRIIRITLTGEDPESIITFLGTLSAKMQDFTKNTYGKTTLMQLGDPKSTEQPVSPQPKREIALGSALGVVFGLLAIFIVDCVQQEKEQR